MLKKVIGHFTTITRHKILVMKECFKIGLYKQGLTHDLSKYSPTEFLVGCKYYQGNRSPNNAEREETGIFAALVIAAAVLWLVAAVLVPAALVKFCWLYLMR